jgi:hypothetical protein
MLDARCIIHPDQVLSSVNPMLFGNFIEFTHDCINQGMWAQLLLNRGFEDPDADGDGVSGLWYKTGFNDSGEEMEQEAAWLASVDPEMPLHISRFFPCYQMKDKAPTPISTIYRLRDIAREKLKYVYTGNC